MNPAEILHVFLTRFNVRSGGKEQNIRQQAGWLEDRFHLFETFCWPSVRNQTRTDFSWLVFFDEATPEPFKEKIRRCAEWKNFVPVFVGQWQTAVVHEAVSKQIRTGHRFLLTSRLDNDDGLDSRFVAHLREAITSPDPAFYIFPDGLIYNHGRVFHHRDESNAFASYFEPIEGFQTVWQVPHHEIHSSRKVNFVAPPHMWFQVVHGSNVSNRVKGRRVTRAEWMAGYAHLQGIPLSGDTPGALLVDRFILSPLRGMREAAIRTIKPIVRGTRKHR